MLKIAVDKITPRIQYVFDRIRDFRGIEFTLVAIDTLVERNEMYFYSQDIHTKDKGFKAANLLYETTLSKTILSKAIFREQECLAFDTVADPLASIFYHLTRMEEYAYQTPDFHGRFQAKDSFLVKYGWEKYLMVERWIDDFLADYHQKMKSSFENSYPPLKLLLTFDIDNTFAFKWKPITRVLGSYVKDMMRFDFKRMAAKTATLLQFRKDPYDTFNKILQYHKNGVAVQLFWLLGDTDTYDRNVSNTSKKHRAFICEIGVELSIGLHPSYASNKSFDKLLKEKEHIENILKQPVETSRQHFLKLRFPDTYQQSQKAGFKSDYTLGFGDVIGFRSGTIQAFPFFDLEKDQQQDYWIHPFSYMDGTLKDYLKLSVEQSKKEINELIVEASRFGGDFIIIWHNETISEWHDWKGWSELITYTIQRTNEVNN